MIEQNGLVPTDFGFEELEKVFGSLEEKESLFNFGFSCVVNLGQFWGELAFKSFNNGCLLLDMVFRHVFEYLSDRDWEYQVSFG